MGLGDKNNWPYLDPNEDWIIVEGAPPLLGGNLVCLTVYVNELEVQTLDGVVTVRRTNRNRIDGYKLYPIFEPSPLPNEARFYCAKCFGKFLEGQTVKIVAELPGPVHRTDYYCKLCYKDYMKGYRPYAK